MPTGDITQDGSGNAYINAAGDLVICDCASLACDPEDIVSVTVVLSGITLCGCTMVAGIGAGSFDLSAVPSGTVTMISGTDETYTGAGFFQIRKALGVYFRNYVADDCSGTPVSLQAMLVVQISGGVLSIFIIRIQTGSSTIVTTTTAFEGTSTPCTPNTVANNWTIDDCPVSSEFLVYAYGGSATAVIACP